MNARRFAAVKREVIARHPPSRGANLLGMNLDFDYFLSRSPLLQDVNVRKTGEGTSLLEVRCKADTSDRSASEILAAIERIWMTDLRYEHFEAHTGHYSEDEAMLEFVTVIDDEAFYVTGSIRVDLRGVR